MLEHSGIANVPAFVWQRITETQLMGMTPDRITTEEVDGLLLSRFSELRQSGSTKRCVFVAARFGRKSFSLSNN